MKYIKQGFAISVPVNEEYAVRANILKADTDKPNIYDFTLEISQNNIGQYHCVAGDEVYRMESDSINKDVADYILRIYQEGFFSAIIKKYEYVVSFMEFGTWNYERR